MYKYMYVEATTSGMFREADHRELIDNYSKEGWRYVSAIPTEFYGNNGQIQTFDLVFEKKCDE
ncbi:DUF4177 domain-containing protein [Clostridium sardiniense]|uniref:DUF4177 domain-containing protein n=1 Tax=Clostridium sardiniense TaxID=29369 RepID=UPI00195D7B2B|nr:DUF4177 domain-containing protein [Clostridium sardiniense]MBM7833284.1 hypothetical protein [Clostridium sardiniense]